MAKIDVPRRCPKLRTLRERLAGQQLTNVHVMMTADALGKVRRLAERENVPASAIIRRAVSAFIHDKG
jgi:hypothetical protein